MEVSIVLKKEMMTQAKKFARERNMSFDQFVCKALRLHIKKKKNEESDKKKIRI